MSVWLYLLVSRLLLVANPGQQAGSNVLGDTRVNATSYVYAVAYVEVMASSSAKAIDLFKIYRTASAKQDGYVSVEVFEHHD